MQRMHRQLAAEVLGTFVLVLGGCGAAILAAGFDPGGIGLLGVSIAFGLTVLTMAYAVGHISGGHFNPAVTLGLLVAGKFDLRDALPYIVAQVLGAIAAAAVIYVIAHGVDGFDASSSGFAANGYDDHSPGGYSLLAGFVSELTLTAVFLVIILGVTSRRAPGGVAPLAIGMAFALIHLISIPVTNTSVNPARSTGPALFVGDWALEQLWMFWVAPILGGAIGALIHRYVLEEPGDLPDEGMFIEEVVIIET